MKIHSILFILFFKVFTKVNSFEAKLIQILNWYVALDFTETPRYSKSEICYFSLFLLEKWNKIISLKRFRGFSIPSQYSMTLSKRFEWHWSHEWSTKLETILLLEYCGSRPKIGFSSSIPNGWTCSSSFDVQKIKWCSSSFNVL